MAMQNRHMSEATEAALEARIRVQELVEEDGVITPMEAELVHHMDMVVLQCETHDVAAQMIGQLMHRADAGPNKPMAMRVREVNELWTQRHTYGSDSAVERRHLIDWQADKAA